VIVGIGVDIVEISRIRKSLARYGDRFADKILTDAEKAAFREATDQGAWLAKRFAAKEAVAKALGTGMRRGVHFRQMIVDRKKSGAPFITLSGAAEKRAEALGVSGRHLSISDEDAYAVAFVVLERGAD